MIKCFTQQVDDGKIEIIDPELKKQLNLTTEDLRFADHIVRHVMEDRQDVFLDGTGKFLIPKKANSYAYSYLQIIFFLKSCLVLNFLV